MKKNELIHLHSLLGQVARDLSSRGELTAEDLTEYRELGTSPMTIRGSRSEHETAVLELASVLADVVGDVDHDERDADPELVA